MGSAVGAASSTIGGITNVSVGTTLEKSVAVIDLGAEGVVQRLSKTGDLIDKEVQSLSTEVTSKAAAGAESSQSLVVACMCVGAIAGALAPSSSGAARRRSARRAARASSRTRAR